MQVVPTSHVRLWAIGAGCGVIALAGSIAFAGSNASVSSSAIAPIAPSGADGVDIRAARTCHSNHPCLLGKNNGVGIGVQGISKSGFGVFGQTTFFSKFAGAAGVAGLDLATPNPRGTPFNNAGVFGQSRTGFGVEALSDSGSAYRVLIYGHSRTGQLGGYTRTIESTPRQPGAPR